MSVTEAARARRVARHVKARTFTMLAATPPQWIPECLRETRELGFAGAREVPGGVTFCGKLPDCYRANLRMAVASRIWLLWPEFGAGATEQLFAKAAAIPWDCFLNPHIPVRIEARVRRSRISHEGRAADAVHASVSRVFADHQVDPPAFISASPPDPQQDSQETGDRNPKQRIHVEIRENRCQIRIDTSGPDLGYRGYRLKGSPAPVKETTAAALIRWAEGITGPPDVFYDPMCGSGTLPIEASMKYLGIAPGRMREFLFQQQPCFQHGAWRHELRVADSVDPVSSCESAGTPGRVPPVYAGDIDAAAIAAAGENAARAGVNVRFGLKDFFSAPPDFTESGTRLMMINPPYGVRLPSNRDVLYPRIAESLVSMYADWYVCLLIPDGASFRSLSGLLSPGVRKSIICRLAGERRFFNGGIGVRAVLLRPFPSG